MFVFVPELFKCNSKLLWRLGSLNGLREAVPKQCSMEEKLFEVGRVGLGTT